MGLERDQYREIVQHYSKEPAGWRQTVYHLLAFKDEALGAESAYEQQSAQLLLSHLRRTPQTWYHGGAVGRAVGDMLEPPRVTGSAPRRDQMIVPDSRDHVYVSHSVLTARLFVRSNLKAGVPSCVYIVKPQGEIDIDRTSLRLGLFLLADRELAAQIGKVAIADIFTRYRCEGAKIIGVSKGQPQRTDAKPSQDIAKHMLRRLAVAPMEAL